MTTNTKQTNQKKSTDKKTRHTFSPGEAQQQYDSEVLEINRVVRVVKGGRRFSFRASVVVGDRHGKVGLGLGKSKDVQSAISKAYDDGTRNMIDVKMHKNTIRHQVRAKYNGSEVMLKPARPGTGIIAGGTVRLISDLAGVHDLVSKRLGSANKVNTAKASLKALDNIRVSNGEAEKSNEKNETNKKND